MSKRDRERSDPLEYRREAVRLYYEEGLTLAEITERLGIRSPHRVKQWMQRYRREGEAFFLSGRGRCGRKKRGESTEEYIARLEMEVELLKKYQSELRDIMLAKRNIGRSSTTGRSTR